MKLKKKSIFKKSNEVADKVENKEERRFDNLRDIMDMSLDFSIYYSGVENDTYFKGCYDMGVRYFLMSYHYLQGLRVPLEKKYAGLGVKFFIDSGAFTYGNDSKYREVGVDYWEEHIKKYLKWAEKNKEYIFAIANCDFELFLPGHIVKEWNEKYFEPFMLRTGIPVCFVHHDATVMTWEQYCQRYPYVGFSSANAVDGDLSFQQLHDHLRIAEKYNTLVHGFGMTKTSLLPKLPYYTVDSTSWKSGFRYGQLAFWNDNKKKVQMLTKDGFETAFKYIQNYDIDPPIDKEKIYDYYEPEVLRANVFAYQKAEEFIRESLKPLTYWKKAKAHKRKSLSELQFPSLNWCESKEHDGWEIYANAFNVNVDNKDFAIWSVINATVFTHWEDFKDTDFVKKIYNHILIDGLHTDWVNTIRETEEEKIEDLGAFYTNCLLGEDDRLLHHGTNFDRTVKERDEYIDDTEYAFVDVPDVEIQNLAAKFLPLKEKDLEGDEMPEIDELDDEIFEENGIIPVRDAEGKFIKGQRQVMKPKKLYSDKYPKLACSTCVNAQKCPEYKDGYVCAYNKMFQRYNSRNLNDIVDAMEGIADLSMMRLQRAMFTETLNGGIPDPAVSQLMNQSTGLLANLVKLQQMRNMEVVRQTDIVRADGSREVTTQVQSNPQNGGILSKLFEGMMNGKKEEVVEAKEVNEVVESVGVDQDDME